jgi:hypothetical protein
MGGSHRFGVLQVIALACAPLLAAVSASGAAIAREEAVGRPNLVVRTRDARNGEPVPARVHVTPAGGLRALFPEPRVAPPEDSLDGEVSLQLPAGRYAVTVSHGPEWSIAREVVEIGAGRGTPAALNLELRREVDPGDWVAADLHVHTDASPDGRVGGAARVASLAVEGLRFAVATDHNRVTQLPTVPSPGAGLRTAAGVEVTTWAPELGHFNVFPLPPSAGAPRRGAPDYDGREVGELLASLGELAEDVLVQVNHPRLEDHIAFFALHGIEPRAGLDVSDPRFRFDALEVYNGFDVARPDRVRAVFLEWLALRAAGLPVVATGNSDAHDAARQLPGYPRTYVMVPGAGEPGARLRPPDVRAVVAGIRAGRAVVSNGPLIRVSVLGAGPGERAVLDRRARRARTAPLRFRASLPRWMSLSRLEVWRGTERVLTRPLEASAREHDLVVSVPLAPCPEGTRACRQELVALVEGDVPMPLLPRRDVTPLAFSNPIVVE